MSLSLDAVAENRMLATWSELLDRHPRQRNDFAASDAELIPLADGDSLLAVTIDTIEEEIALGFYRDAETIGWVAAAASLSDLAAVGATPIGLLVSVNLPHQACQAGIARGLSAACRESGTFVLGGDTNTAERISITSCAVGMVQESAVLRRRSCAPGDLVYATGPLGAGAALAAATILELADEQAPPFRPRPRLEEARLLAPHVSAAMDTSDGLVATLDQLARLNQVGFEVAAAPIELLEPGARRLCTRLGAPALAFLAAHHGEFELVLTVPESEQDAFEAVARVHDMPVLRLGRATRECRLRIDGRAIDGCALRNLAESASRDPRRYIDSLLQQVS